LFDESLIIYSSSYILNVIVAHSWAGGNVDAVKKPVHRDAMNRFAGRGSGVCPAFSA